MSKKKLYRVACVGCDDTTSVKVWLSDEQYSGVKKVVSAVNEACEDHCQPTMHIKEVDDAVSTAERE